jgi:hypothetical protein
LTELNSGDDFRIMQALSDLSESISLGTEESLFGFDLDSFVPALIGLLHMEHNPEIMRASYLLSGGENYCPLTQGIFVLRAWQ